MSANDPLRPIEREHLIHPAGLLVLAAVITLILYLMFPRETVFTTRDILDRPDAVTLEYLRLLLRSDPGNTEVREHLVTQLRLAGRYEEALRELSPLLDDPAFLNDPQHYTQYLNLLAQYMFAQTRPDDRAAAQRRLESALRRLLTLPWPAERIRATLALTREWVRPSVQVEIQEWLLARARDADEERQLHLEMTRLYQAQGRPDQAMHHLRQAYALAPDAQKPALAIRMMNLRLASGDPYGALILAPDLVRRHPDDPDVLDKAIDVARQNGRADLALDWQRQRYALTPQDMTLGWALFDAEIAQGNLDGALRLVPRLATSAQSPERVRKIAQAYTWSGRTEDAYPWWQKHAAMTGNEADRRAAWQMAIGLYRLPDARRILEHIARERSLTQEERDTLFGLYLDIGDTEAARRLLEKEYARTPGDPAILNQLYSLLIDLRDWSAAIALLEAEERANRLDPEKRLELVNLYWLQRDPERSYAVLRRAGPDHQTPEYWSLRLQLALYLEDFEDARDALRALLASPEGATDLAPDLPLAVANGLALSGKTVEAARLMYQAALRNGDEQARLQAIALALTAGLIDEARTWVAQTPLPRSDSRRGLYWSLKAQLATLEGDSQRAIAAWEQALAYAPDNPAYRDAFLWALIGDAGPGSATLRSYLDYYRVTGADDSSLWPILAFGYSALGDSTQALAWFRLGLPSHQQDVDWLMGMAEAFRLGGYDDYAWRLRQYTWQLLRPRLLGRGGDAHPDQALRLVREFEGNTAARAALESPGAARLSDSDKLELLLEWALADGHRVLSHFYYQQAISRSLRLPGWQHLAMALQSNDASGMEAAFRGFNRLPLADSVLARHRLGERTEALRFGLVSLTDQLDEENVKQVRSLTASLRTDLERGFRLESTRQTRDLLDLQSWGLVTAGLYDDHGWGAALHHYQLSPASALRPEVGNQQDALFHWRQLSRGTDWRMGLSLHDRPQKTTWGVSVAWQRIADEGLSYGMTLTYNQRPEISGTTWAWGLEQGGRINLTTGLDSRTSASMEAGWRRISSIWGAELGRGPFAQASLNHLLFLNDPAWQVGADVQWYRFTGNALADARLNALFDTLPEAATLLPERYGRVGFTTMWYHGQVHRIAHEVPSPRWHLGLSVGYQWERSVMDYGVSAGLGWRVAGDDELALSFDWTSESAAGGDNLMIRISYNSYMGR
ncbi:MAG: hypothetical protein D6758_06840 [Gammaproteobacteria bacterium]|nr:MAG: hypothetical protein D6758_06840 [Gammaproteobacteria bacterium]